MKNQGISSLLKRKRLEKGLSLSQLARRVDTSPSTLSRYENGWQRFEIYTLRKIAAALGCRLHVDFLPLQSATEQEKVNKENVIQTIKRLFWDKPLTSALMDSHQQWVVQRVLETGNMKDVHILQSCLGKELFLQTVSRINFSSRKTDSFWKEILKKENIKCTKKSFRETAKNYWPA